MSDVNMVVRRGRDGNLLLLQCSCTGMRGAIALGKGDCERSWHSAVKTDNFQRPHCIDFQLTERSYERSNATLAKCSAIYTVERGAGTFHIYLYWHWGHSPSPEIRSMEVWCYGV